MQQTHDHNCQHYDSVLKLRSSVTLGTWLLAGRRRNHVAFCKETASVLRRSPRDPHVLRLIPPQKSQDMSRAVNRAQLAVPLRIFWSRYWHFNWSPADFGPPNIRSALTHVDVILSPYVWNLERIRSAVRDLIDFYDSSSCRKLKKIWFKIVHKCLHPAINFGSLGISFYCE